MEQGQPPDAAGQPQTPPGNHDSLGLHILVGADRPRHSEIKYSRRPRQPPQPALPLEAVEPEHVVEADELPLEQQPPPEELPLEQQLLEADDEHVEEAYDDELVEEDPNFSWHIDNKDIIDFNKRTVFDQGAIVCCSHAASLEDCELVYQIENQRRAPPLSVQHEINEVPKAYPDECQPWEDESRVQPCKARTALKFVEEFGVCLKKDFKFKGRVTDKIAPNRGKRMRLQDVEEFESGEQPETYVRSIIRECPIVGEMLYHPIFDDHKEGVFMAPIGQTFKSLHAVVIIGYGIEDGIRFYWIKNSHGRKWGSRGIGKVDASLFVCFARPIKPYMQQIGEARRRKRRRQN